MTWMDFWAAYTNECPKERDEFALHFRFSTAGGVEKGNCHPFPLSNEVMELKKTKWRGGQALMHNGVLGKGLGTLSDTMVWIMNEVFYLKDILKDKDVVEYIEEYTTGSKLLFFYENEFFSTGKWEEEKETGLYYSNWGYKEWKRVVYSPKGNQFGWSPQGYNDDTYLYGARGDKWNKWHSSWRGYKPGVPENPVFSKTSVSEDADALIYEKVECCVGCKAHKSHLSFSGVFNEILCIVCGCKFDSDLEIIEWDRDAWDKVWVDRERIKDEEKGIRTICYDCKSTTANYLVWDTGTEQWWCLSCEKFV